MTTPNTTSVFACWQWRFRAARVCSAAPACRWTPHRGGQAFFPPTVTRRIDARVAVIESALRTYGTVSIFAANPWPPTTRFQNHRIRFPTLYNHVGGLMRVRVFVYKNIARPLSGPLLQLASQFPSKEWEES